MSTYPVAETEAGLTDLIDRVVAGDEVVITRAGQPVAELRSAVVAPTSGNTPALQRLLAHQFTPPPGTPSSVELLHRIYEEPNGRCLPAGPGRPWRPAGAR